MTAFRRLLVKVPVDDAISAETLRAHLDGVLRRRRAEAVTTGVANGADHGGVDNGAVDNTVGTPPARVHWPAVEVTVAPENVARPGRSRAETGGIRRPNAGDPPPD